MPATTNEVPERKRSSISWSGRRYPAA